MISYNLNLQEFELVVSARLYIGLSHITITKIRIWFKHILFFDKSLIVLSTHYFAYQHTLYSNYHHMYIHIGPFSINSAGLGQSSV